MRSGAEDWKIEESTLRDGQIDDDWEVKLLL